jgi:uncharacterized membrane protein YebE (DUF533 family)
MARTAAASTLAAPSAALLIDLYHAAKADGHLLDAEHAMVGDLSDARGIALEG